MNTLVSESGWKDLPRHHDEDQVQLDVDRSFVNYPKNESEKKRSSRKHDLSQVIRGVLRSHPMLHYFQGYHDIVQVLLLVLGPDVAVPAASRLSLLRIRDFMLPTMSGTEPHLHLLGPILRAADVQVARHLTETQPFFALSSTLTWFAHDIEDYGDIARLLDFLLASEAVVPLYLFAVIVISRKNELLDLPPDEPDMLYLTLSKLPKPLDLEAIIQRTRELFRNHPPERLPGRTWARISSSSVLKTTRDFNALHQQTLQDGERFFAIEAARIRDREMWVKRQRQLSKNLFKYRRGAVWTGTAVLVAALAFYGRQFSIPPFVASWSPSWRSLQGNMMELYQRFFSR